MINSMPVPDAFYDLGLFIIVEKVRGIYGVRIR